MDPPDTGRIIKEKKLKLIEIYNDIINIKIGRLRADKNTKSEMILEGQIHILIDLLKNV